MLPSQFALAGTELNNVGFVTPPSLAPTRIQAGLPCKRTTTVKDAEKTSYSNGGDKRCIIIFPANGMYDPRRSFITFAAKITKTGGTYARLAQYSDCWINSAKVLTQTNTPVHTQENYNEITGMLREMSMKQEVRDTYGKWLGIGTEAERNTWGTTTTYYVLPLYGGFLNTELIVTKALKAPLQIELLIDDPLRFIETDGTSPHLEILDMKIHLDTLHFNPGEEAARVSAASAGQTIGFRTWVRSENKIDGNAASEIVLTQKNSSINGFAHILKDTTKQYITTENDKFRKFPPAAATAVLNYMQLKIDSKNFYEDKLDLNYCDKFIPFQFYSRWMQDWKLNGMMEGDLPIHQGNFGVDKFILLNDFEAYPEMIDLVNSFNSLTPNGEIRLRLEFSDIVPAGWVCHSWGEYYQISTIYPDGTVKTAD